MEGAAGQRLGLGRRGQCRPSPGSGRARLDASRDGEDDGGVPNSRLVRFIRHPDGIGINRQGTSVRRKFCIEN